MDVGLAVGRRERGHVRGVGAGRALGHRALLPGRFVTLSVDVLPEIREYERTSTTVINAYVAPPVSRYLTSLRAGRTLPEASVSQIS